MNYLQTIQTSEITDNQTDIRTDCNSVTFKNQGEQIALLSINGGANIELEAEGGGFADINHPEIVMTDTISITFSGTGSKKLLFIRKTITSTF